MAPLRHGLAAALALACAGTALTSAPAGAATPQTRPDFRGVWLNEKPATALVPVGGGAPPLTAAGQKAWAENRAEIAAKAGKPRERDDLSHCLPLGPTRILLAPYPLQIVQRNDLVVFLFEHNHVFETVYFKEAAAPDPDSDPTYQGYAVGRWESGRMAVDNSKLNDQTYLDDTGLPHGEQIKVTRLFERSADGKSLQITSTIDDPEMYSRPWQARVTMTLRPDMRVEEYTCGQGTLETRYSRRGLPEPAR